MVPMTLRFPFVMDRLSVVFNASVLARLIIFCGMEYFSM